VVGLHFDSEEVRDAARGNIVIAYGDDDDSENLVGGEYPADLVEIFYMPIRALDGSVIALGEFYHNLKSTTDRS
jgi:hypothetical protein